MHDERSSSTLTTGDGPAATGISRRTLLKGAVAGGLALSFSTGALALWQSANTVSGPIAFAFDYDEGVLVLLSKTSATSEAYDVTVRVEGIDTEVFTDVTGAEMLELRSEHFTVSAIEPPGPAA